MNRILLLTVFVCINLFSSAQVWKAKWITNKSIDSGISSFYAFRKQINLTQSVPKKLIARIAVDSKYFLWINDKLIVFEGGLKRGPNPNDTYFDEIDIAPYLQSGNNLISIMVWYFGINGFSHKSSGKAGLLFDCQSPEINIISDNNWQCSLLAAYQVVSTSKPNFRLSESSVLYDATKDIGHWQSDLSIPLNQAIEIGDAGIMPWNQLIKRPIPLWKNNGLLVYKDQSTYATDTTNIYIGTLPYNAQVTPYFKINAAESGQKIMVCTDNYIDNYGAEAGIRFEYITKKGIQEFELPGWINGHKVIYTMPKSVSLIETKYRETGYDTEFEGSFQCNDPFFTNYWKKAARTLYVNMRDTYMDCPDRERAQWASDAVHESAEAFYALSPSSQQLTKKWLYELLNWQTADGTLFSPVPAGNWDIDLPDQTLTAIGYYGVWNYYKHSGDKKLLTDFYPTIVRYLNLWEPDEGGMVKSRYGYELWGDRTDNKDIRLIVNELYYLTLKCICNAALELNQVSDYHFYADKMKLFKETFNVKFWNGKSYRDPNYKSFTDDRAQALAVVAGLADKEKYPFILTILQNEFHASTFMEKFVFEAMFQMGYINEALDRFKKRFLNMVNEERFSTLWEDWTYGFGIYGGSTINHAWSGGGLIVLSEYLSGISPISAGYNSFQIIPQYNTVVTNVSTTVSSVAGIIKSEFSFSENKYLLNATVPKGTDCVIGIKNRYQRISINGTVAWESGYYLSNSMYTPVIDADTAIVKFKLKEGVWNINANSFDTANRIPLDINSVNIKDTVLCKGDSLLLTANNGISFQWFKNDTLLKNSNKKYLNVWDSGYYYVLSKNAIGEIVKSKIFHVSIGIAPNLFVQPTISFNNNNELVANYGVAFQWFRNQILIPNAVNKVYKPLDNASYTVASIINGCFSSQSNAINFISNPIFEIDKNNYISFFPNPVIDYIKVVFRLVNDQPVRVAIFNEIGKKMLDFNNVKNGDNLSLISLVRGIYLITFTTVVSDIKYSSILIK